MEEIVRKIIEDSLTHAGYEIVRIMFTGKSIKTLQIMVDRLDGADIKIEDCENVSRLVSALMDVEDPISYNYNLEVSSAGIDRPLTRMKDFEKYIGFEAKITTSEKINNMRHLKGNLLAVNGNIVQIFNDASNEAIDVDFANIHAAKLVLNDKLMKAKENIKLDGEN